MYVERQRQHPSLVFVALDLTLYLIFKNIFCDLQHATVFVPSPRRRMVLGDDGGSSMVAGRNESYKSITWSLFMETEIFLLSMFQTFTVSNQEHLRF